MSQISIDFAKVLRDNGLSLTRQRREIFELLEQNPPLSMHELYNLMNGSLDRASLYRTIAAFERLGIARRVNIGWKYKIELSDMFAEHHHHLTCLRCHSVTPINEAELETAIGQLAATHGFTPLEHQIEIQGHCNSCH